MVIITAIVNMYELNRVVPHARTVRILRYE